MENKFILFYSFIPHDIDIIMHFMILPNLGSAENWRSGEISVNLTRLSTVHNIWVVGSVNFWIVRAPVRPVSSRYNVS